MTQKFAHIREIRGKDFALPVLQIAGFESAQTKNLNERARANGSKASSCFSDPKGTKATTFLAFVPSWFNLNPRERTRARNCIRQ